MTRNPWARTAGEVLLVATLLLCGSCRSTVDLCPEDRASIRCVSVDPEVAVQHLPGAHPPPSPEEEALAESKEALADSLVGLYYAHRGKARPPGGGSAVDLSSDGGDLNAAWLQSGIDIGRIVRTEFVAELERRRPFPSIDQSGGDARFQLEVRQCYFSWAFTGASPVLEVAVKLVKPDGRVVFEDYELMNSLSSETPSHSEAEYIGDPELMRTAMSAAAKVLTRDLVSNLMEE